MQIFLNSFFFFNCHKINLNKNSYNATTTKKKTQSYKLTFSCFMQYKISYFPFLDCQDFSASYLPRWACSRWGWSQWRACRSAGLFPARRRCPRWGSARSGPVDRGPSLSSSHSAEPALIPECLFLPPYTASGTTSWSPPWPPSPLTGLWRKEKGENVIEMASKNELQILN